VALRGFAEVIHRLAARETVGGIRIDARGAEAEGIEGIGRVEMEFAEKNACVGALALVVRFRSPRCRDGTE
jgi:hypothetical protein